MLITTTKSRFYTVDECRMQWESIILALHHKDSTVANPPWLSKCLPRKTLALAMHHITCALAQVAQYYTSCLYRLYCYRPYSKLGTITGPYFIGAL